VPAVEAGCHIQPGLPRPGDSICISDQRRTALKFREELGPVAGDECEVHRRSFAVGIGFGLEEIGMAVDEE
jgi:hypothetical protein